MDLLVDSGAYVRFLFWEISAGCDRGQVRVMAAEKQERRVALKGFVLEDALGVEARDDADLGFEELIFNDVKFSAIAEQISIPSKIS